ncbi:D-aminoacyl-tRNA deacylase [Sedimenticola sp.]|uniref:D-aminoacyl-tRNA deacylase n=1 Tax=Sedimenticola sp. TaxID=1940285 RepID=UPI003D0C9F4C
MIGLLQRVTEASVRVDGEMIASINKGIVVLVGVERGDTEAEADRLLERLLGYRVFADDAGKMNLSLRDIKGDLLLVPQFTLPADTRKGTRPGFSTAAEPADGEFLFKYLIRQAQKSYSEVTFGRFGADMQVALVNDGPVTFWLQVSPQNGSVR